jgi:hypothetical protein
MNKAEIYNFLIIRPINKSLYLCRKLCGFTQYIRWYLYKTVLAKGKDCPRLRTVLALRGLSSFVIKLFFSK